MRIKLKVKEWSIIFEHRFHHISFLVLTLISATCERGKNFKTIYIGLDLDIKKASKMTNIELISFIH